MKKVIRRVKKLKDPKKFLENALLMILVGSIIGSLAAFIHAAF